MKMNYETIIDESGVYIAHNPASPGVFVEADTENALRHQICLAEADLEKIQSDRPALRSSFHDLTRRLLSDYGFVNRGMGDGNYEVWAKAEVFLTVPAPIRAQKTARYIASYAFLVWRREVDMK